MECWLCNNTGKFKDPNNKEEYDRLFDMYDRPGTISMGECRDRVLKEVGYTIIPCPECDKGKYFAALLEYRKNAMDIVATSEKLLSTLQISDMQDKITEVKSWIENFAQVIKSTEDELYDKFNYRINEK